MIRSTYTPIRQEATISWTFHLLKHLRDKELFGAKERNAPEKERNEHCKDIASQRNPREPKTFQRCHRRKTEQIAASEQV